VEKKIFEKIQQYFIIKALRKVGIEGMYLNVVRVYMINLWPASYSMEKN
jgi:hypothetical protein